MDIIKLANDKYVKYLIYLLLFIFIFCSFMENNMFVIAIWFIVYNLLSVFIDNSYVNIIVSVIISLMFAQKKHSKESFHVVSHVHTDSGGTRTTLNTGGTRTTLNTVDTSKTGKRIIDCSCANDMSEVYEQIINVKDEMIEKRDSDISEYKNLLEQQRAQGDILQDKIDSQQTSLNLITNITS